MKNYGLRLLKDADAEIFERWEKCDRPYPWTKAQFLEEKNSETFHTLVLEEDASVRGYASVQIVEKEVYLANMGVDPKVRGEGHGRELLRCILEWSRERGARKMTLDVDVKNEKAIGLYLREGFQKVNERSNAYPHGESAYLMSKELK